MLLDSLQVKKLLVGCVCLILLCMKLIIAKLTTFLPALLKGGLELRNKDSTYECFLRTSCPKITFEYSSERTDRLSKISIDTYSDF